MCPVFFWNRVPDPGQFLEREFLELLAWARTAAHGMKEAVHPGLGPGKGCGPEGTAKPEAPGQPGTRQRERQKVSRGSLPSWLRATGLRPAPRIGTRTRHPIKNGRRFQKCSAKATGFVCRGEAQAGQVVSVAALVIAAENASIVAVAFVGRLRRPSQEGQHTTRLRRESKTAKRSSLASSGRLSPAILSRSRTSPAIAGLRRARLHPGLCNPERRAHIRRRVTDPRPVASQLGSGALTPER